MFVKGKLFAVLCVSALMCGICLSGCSAGERSADGEGDPSLSEQVSEEQLEKMYLESTDAFAFRFSSAALGQAQENLCVSPVSLYYVLGMLASGVEGSAQTQLLEVLHAQDSEQLGMMCRYGLNGLDSEGELYRISIADSIWVSSDYRITDRFKSISTEGFGAEAFNVEFGTKQADNDMSKWVHDKTNGLISPNFQTQKDQIASLVNTIYFKDAWVDQFETGDTERRIFHAIDEDISVPFMNGTLDGCGYADLGYATMAELYFTSGATMTLYLPAIGSASQELVSTPEAALALLSAEPTSFPNIDISIPKFSFPTDMGDLIPILSEMGIHDVFSNPTGDAFDGMLEYTGDGTPGVPYVSEVKQETNISISEEGVEAAAYTEAGIMEMSAPDPSQPISFIADRPFLFKITAPDSAIIFVGIVMDPAQQ